jgi:hypothetical protein
LPNRVELFFASKNGGERWNAPVEVADLIARGFGSLSGYSPRMRYLLTMDSMITDKMQRWQEEMRSEGREEGKSLGAGELLERLLELRFGALDSGVIERIRSADFESIKNWTARALEASRIEHVFEKKLH